VKRRELYRVVAKLVAESGGSRQLLDRVVGAMRGQRHLDTQSFTNHLDSIAALLAEDDALGQIYQAINAPALENAYLATTRENRKFNQSEIPAVTQLFTPRFVIEFLLENTLGRLRGGTKLVRDIRIIDPACGTMNFGVVAIEMLDEMYREELSRLGPERASIASEEQIPQAIVQNNLFGIDIDQTALELAAQTLSMKLRLPVEQCRVNLWRGDALFEPELEARCVGAFDVVVTNPPYLSARNLPAARVAQMKQRYRAGWRDACTCFLQRSLQFAREGGYVGILAMQSFMFTGAFEKLRRELARLAAIEAIAQFGPGLFEIGNPGTLQTAVVVMRKEADETKREENEVMALRLVEVEGKEGAMRRLGHSRTGAAVATMPASPISARNAERGDAGVAATKIEGREWVFRITQREMLSAPRGAWVYWLSPQMRHVFRTCRKLGDIAPPRQGLATTDNARFVRYWWEVEPTRADAPCRASLDTWFPYVKSGRFRRWFESPRHRVNWADDGREIKQSIAQRYPYLNGRWEWVAKNSQFYGRAGVTYSYLTAGQFSARLMPAGAIFDVAGSALFPEDPLTMLAILNSATAQQLLHAVNPTVNFQVGDLANLPIPRARDERLHVLAERAVSLQRKLDGFDETSPEFLSPAPWKGESLDGILSEIGCVEREIDQSVAKLYGLMQDERSRNCETAELCEQARRWISFVIGRVMGRWGCDREIDLLPLCPSPSTILQRLRAELIALTNAVAAREIEEAVGGIEAFLAAPFYAWHVKLYRHRPTYWALGDRGRQALFLHDFATPELLQPVIEVPRGWKRFVDDGIALNLSPLADLMPEATLARKLHQTKSDLEPGRFAWSCTHAAMFNRGSTRGCA
jgi:hypothetical protein